MLSILAAATLLAAPPVTAPGAEVEPTQIAYDFRFSVDASDLATPAARERTEQRLHREAARYCRARTRAAGDREQAALCTQVVMKAVKARMDERADAVRMAQR